MARNHNTILELIYSTDQSEPPFLGLYSVIAQVHLLRTSLAVNLKRFGLPPTLTKWRLLDSSLQRPQTSKLLFSRDPLRKLLRLFSEASEINQAIFIAFRSTILCCIRCNFIFIFNVLTLALDLSMLIMLIFIMKNIRRKNTQKSNNLCDFNSFY